MRIVKVPALVAAFAAALSACAAAPLPTGGEPAHVPTGSVSFGNVMLADDGRSVRVDFIGGPEFVPNIPCWVGYEATAEIVDDTLEIGIYAQPHPQPLPPDTGCSAVGYSRTLTIELEEPFSGTVVRDLAGRTFLLEAPPGLAQIGDLPQGWELRREGNILGSATPRWEQVWSPDPDSRPAGGDSMLTLIQALDGALQATRDERGRPIEINGGEGALSLHPPTGSMVLVWSIGDDELLLEGYRSDFSEAEFIALAGSVDQSSE